MALESHQQLPQEFTKASKRAVLMAVKRLNSSGKLFLMLLFRRLTTLTIKSLTALAQQLRFFPVSRHEWPF